MTRYTARSLFALVTVFLLGLPAEAQQRRDVPDFRTYGEPASDGDATAIEAFLEQYKDAWARQDTDAFIALHAGDTEWINAYARLFQGAAPLAEFLDSQLFPAFEPDVSKQELANMRTISIRYLGDVAVVHIYTDGERGESRNDGEEMRRTHLHLVVGKQGDAWRVVHTAIMDAR